MFIHFLCLCPLGRTIMLEFNVSKVAYCLWMECQLTTEYQLPFWSVALTLSQSFILLSDERHFKCEDNKTTYTSTSQGGKMTRLLLKGGGGTLLCKRTNMPFVPLVVKNGVCYAVRWSVSKGVHRELVWSLSKY